MHPDPLSFLPIPSEPSQPSRSSERAAGDSAFAALYSEAIEAANQELSQIASDDSTGAGGDPMSFLELRASGSPFAVSSPLTPMSGDLSAMQGELMQHVAAIRSGQGQAAVGNVGREGTAFSPANAAAALVTPAGQKAEGGVSSCVHRLISWIDEHAHLHSSHHCAASVRQAMEAGGIQTADRPSSGDAGDYGPFLLRHGAQVIPQESYEPKAGDIAVFDRTDDHPAGHIQVFDGEHWVSDFVQHSFSPYRDQESTPPATVYRLS